METKNYDIALEQYQNETGFSEKEFQENIKEYGEDYIDYYVKRFYEVKNYTKQLDPEYDWN